MSPTQAAADLNSIGNNLQKPYPKDNGKMNVSLARADLYGDTFGRPIRGFVAALMLLAGLILLAACANLGSLFAARAADLRPTRWYWLVRCWLWRCCAAKVEVGW